MFANKTPPQRPPFCICMHLEPRCLPDCDLWRQKIALQTTWASEYFSSQPALEWPIHLPSTYAYQHRTTAPWEYNRKDALSSVHTLCFGFSSSRALNFLLVLSLLLNSTPVIVIGGTYKVIPHNEMIAFIKQNGSIGWSYKTNRVIIICCRERWLTISNHGITISLSLSLHARHK